MRIGFFALSPRKHGGVYQYTVSAIEAFKSLARERNICDVTFIYHRDYAECFRDTEREIKHFGLDNRKLQSEVLLATYCGTPVRTLGRNVFDIAVSPKTCLVGHRTGLKSIVTVHDLQHKALPEFFSFHRKILRDILYGRCARVSDAIICESEYVKDDIVRHCGVGGSKIHVLPSPPPQYIYNAHIDESRCGEVKRKYELPHEYLFYPAQFWPHKNHVRLFEGLKVLKTKYSRDITLVLAGAPKAGFKAAVHRLHELGLASDVLYLGYVPDGEMQYLYTLSKGLILPTLFESISIPVWEAFSLGVPVICADVCGLWEQAGTGAIFINPYDPDDIARGMDELLRDDETGKRMVEEGRKQVGRLSLEGYALSWKKLLAEVQNGSGRVV